MGSKLTPEDALAKAREYIKKSLEGAGAIKGNDGYSPKISENAENTEDVYKLDITNADGSFTTPNLISVDALLYDVSDLVGITSLEPTSTVNNYGLRENGYNFTDSNYKLLRYNVKPGDVLYVRSRNDGSNGVFQFQSNSATYPNATTYLIGSPYTEIYNGYIKVPNNATWLIMSVLKSETVNGVYSVDENKVAELSRNNKIFNLNYATGKISASINSGTTTGVIKLGEFERTSEMKHFYVSFDNLVTNYSYSADYKLYVQVNEYSPTSGSATIGKTRLTESGFAGLNPDTTRIEIYLSIDAVAGNLASASITCENLLITVNGYLSDILNSNVSLGNTLDFQRLVDNMADLPKYYDDYLEERIQTIRNINNSMSMDCDGFIFVTDQHFPLNTGFSTKIAHKIATETNNRMYICGGDVITEALKRQDALNFLHNYVSEVVTLFGADNFRYILGNHDFNKMAISDESIFLEKNNVYNICMKPFESHVTNSERDFYYYWDNEIQKIRYIVLNFYDYVRLKDNYRFIEQFPWLNDVLMATPDGYSIGILIHGMHENYEPVYDDTGNEIGKKPILILHGQYLMDICDAVNNKTTYSCVNDEDASIVYNFDFRNKDLQIMFMLTGHAHVDYEEYTSTGIPVIVTKCDKYSPRMSDGATNTIKEHVVEVVNIDKQKRKIYLTRIGSGYDREIDF